MVEVIDYAAVAISQEAGVTLGSFQSGPSSCEAETCGLQLITEVTVAAEDTGVNKRSRHVKRTVVSGQIKNPHLSAGDCRSLAGWVAVVLTPDNHGGVVGSRPGAVGALLAGGIV